MFCDWFVSLKIIEFILSAACIAAKRVSDTYGESFNILRSKYSYEWPIENRATYSVDSSIFVDIVCGSFLLIPIGLLIGHVTGQLPIGRSMELFFIISGSILFFLVSALVYVTLENVSPELVVYVAVLGTLAFITGLVFIIDALLTARKKKLWRSRQIKPLLFKRMDVDRSTQTDKLLNGYISNGNIPNGNTIPVASPTHDKVVGQLKSSFRKAKGDSEPLRVTFPPDVAPSEENSNQKPISLTEPSQQGARNQKQQEQVPVQGQNTSSDSDIEDLLRIPSVSFLVNERGKHMKSPEGSSSSREMLPMMPMRLTMTDDEVDYLNGRRQDKNSIYQSDRKSRLTSEEEFKGRKYSSQKRSIYIKDEDDNYPEESSSYEFKRVGTQYSSMKSKDEKDSPISPKLYRVEQHHFVNGSTSQAKRVSPKVEELATILSKMTPQEREEYLLESLKAMDNITARRQISPGNMSLLSSDEKQQYILEATTRLENHPSHGEFSNNLASITQYNMDAESLRSRMKSPGETSDISWGFDSRDANFVQKRSRKSPQEDRDSPSSPLDPGYVRHTAHNWPDSTPKTPSQSPDVNPASPRASSDESESRLHSPSEQYQSRGKQIRIPPPPKTPHPSTIQMSLPAHQGAEALDYDEEEFTPSGGSLTTQLLQKWLKQRNTKVTKTKSNP